MINSVFKYITGIVKLRGATDDAQIGNNGDSLFVEVKPKPGTITDQSGTATTTSAIAIPANAARQYLFIQNTSAGNIWFDFDTTAVAASPSIMLGPNDTFVMEGTFVSTDDIHIRSQTGSRDFSAKEG